MCGKQGGWFPIERERERGGGAVKLKAESGKSNWIL